MSMKLRKDSYISLDASSDELNTFVDSDQQIKQKTTFQISKYELIDDYISPTNAAATQKLTHFSIQILKWQQSSHGDFIEYMIEVTYLESQGSKWVIFKRYSDFVDLHESLTDLFSKKQEANLLEKIPELPPQI